MSSIPIIQPQHLRRTNRGWSALQKKQHNFSPRIHRHPWPRSRKCGAPHGRRGFQTRAWRRHDPSRHSGSRRGAARRPAPRSRRPAKRRRRPSRAAAGRPPRGPRGSGPSPRRKGCAPGRAWRLRGNFWGSRRGNVNPWPQALELTMESVAVMLSCRSYANDVSVRVIFCRNHSK